jgi:hypothetical protein
MPNPPLHLQFGRHQGGLVALALAFMLASSSAWAQSDLGFRNQLHCPIDSKYFGRVVMRTDNLPKCYGTASRRLEMKQKPPRAGAERSTRVRTSGR